MNTQHTPNVPSDKVASEGMPTHIYVLLDRSGSMESIRADVIGGFNAFVAGQLEGGDDARLTLVQFDGADPQEVVIDDAPLSVVPDLTMATFVPRGATPLLDATGKLIARAKKRTKARKAMGEPEAVVFVTITDGQENASTQYDVAKIRAQIEKRKAKGWTFVFLSAGPDAYHDAGAMGYGPDAIQAWAADAEGANLTFASMGSSLKHRRHQYRTAAPVAAEEFFNGDKPAEAHKHSTK